ncbi:MAG: ATP-binding protein [Thermoanaerobaculia bacterium]
MPTTRRRRAAPQTATDDATILSSPLPAVALGLDLEFLNANAPALAIFDCTLAELKRTTLPNVVHPEERNWVKGRLEEMRESASTTLRLNIRLARPQQPAGSPALLIAHSVGPVLTVYVVDLSDTLVTSDDRVQLLDAIERAAWEWRRTFDSVEMPIIILGSDLNVARINRAARMLAGKQYGEIIGQPLSRLESAEPWKSISHVSAQVQSTRAPVARQVKDSAGRTLDLLAMLFNAEDPADGRVIVIAWDVTALVDLQIRYEQQRTMATIGALVAGVAHEVRNPLFAISATLDAMEQASDGALQEYFEVLRLEIDRMTALMQDLLAYGRPSTPTFIQTTVSAIIDSALRAAEPLAQKLRVTVRKNVTHEGSVVADRDRLTRALENLVNNAVQHAPPDSEVTVESDMKTRGKGSVIFIRVRDHGRGFGADDLSRVFEPFFSRRKGGTGLGLALVQQIVTEHGGEVIAANASGGGAEVTISIPAPR